ncbi:MAG: DHH family phosphoesterase, partial [Deltaproteobacteria bacterium]|nr:DHH family phosphoesterase [Deltaproteobacteria bacterium]
MEVITTHNTTDFDGLASLVAARILYPGSVAVLPGRLNPNVRAFLSIHKDVFLFAQPSEVSHDDVSRLVVVDTNRWHRLDRFKALQNRQDVDVHVWDHHDNISDMEASVRREEKVGACTTLLVEELLAGRREFSPIQSTLFLAGIYEDTGSLSFPQTTSRDVRAVAELLDRNADLTVLETFLRPSYGPKQKDLLFQMLKKARRTKVDGHRISICKTRVEGHIHALSLVVLM